MLRSSQLGLNLALQRHCASQWDVRDRHQLYVPAVPANGSFQTVILSYKKCQSRQSTFFQTLSFLAPLAKCPPPPSLPQGRRTDVSSPKSLVWSSLDATAPYFEQRFRNETDDVVSPSPDEKLLGEPTPDLVSETPAVHQRASFRVYWDGAVQRGLVPRLVYSGAALLLFLIWFIIMCGTSITLVSSC